MLQDPGEAHKGPWKVNGCTCQQFCIHKNGSAVVYAAGRLQIGLSGLEETVLAALRSSASCGERWLVHS